MAKKINVYLPGIHFKIMGGYKVVYQYCNYLVNKGYDVCIYYNEFNGKNGKHIPRKLSILIKKVLSKNYPKWFKLDKKIKKVVVANYSDKTIRNADISIATSFLTSNEVANLSKEKGKKFYFIQDYENWEGTTDEELIESYKLGMNNIVVSNWLNKKIKQKAEVESKVILNGIDLTKFKVKNPINNRKKMSIAMLYHSDERKGCKYGLEAIFKLKIKYPSLHVELFGSPNRPDDLPDWINYTKNATEDEVVNILNNSSIFICSSLIEGFGLPGIESMACGCALVTTKCIGILEYANDGNALLIEPGDSNEIVNKVSILLEDDNYRIRIATQGNSDSKKRDLNNSCKEFEEYINK